MATELNMLSGSRSSVALPTSPASNASNVVPLPQLQRQEPAVQRKESDTVAVDTAEVDATVQQLNEVAQSVHRSLQFAVDQDTGITVITVRDSETQEVIRQIPAEEMLKLARRMRELSEEASGVKGVLLSAEA